MITQLTINTRNKEWFNTDGTILRTLVIGSDSEYKIKNIDGLGPTKASVVTADLSTEAGGIFLSSRSGQRNIVLTLGFNPDHSVDSDITSLRRALYGVFSPTMLVDLEFDDDILGVMKITGYVETHEPVIFIKDPTVQISIICPNPYFTGPEDFVTVEINYDDTDDGYRFNIDYDGLVPVGFELQLTVAQSANDYGLGMFSENGQFYTLMRRPVLLGDKVTFSSVRGNRFVKYKRGSNVEIDAMPWFEGSLTDAKLYPGRNVFHAAEPGYTAFPFIFKYKIPHGGL